MSIQDFYTQTVKVVTVTEPGQFSTAAGAESCATASAAINPVSGTEVDAGGGNMAFADYRAYMSSTVSIDTTNRLLWGSTYFNVLFVKDTMQMGHHLTVFLRNDAE